jgi:hypothetical protein
MTHKNTDQEIRSRIDIFLTELSALVKQTALESVHTALGDSTTIRRRGPGRPRKIAMRVKRRHGRIATRGLRGKRTSAQVDAVASRVLTQVRAKQGLRLEEIGRALKTPTKILKLPVAKLMAAKKLKKKGQKRGTKYFVR